MAENSKNLFANIIDLIKIIIWPLIVLLFFFSFKSELTSIVREVPNKIKHSSKLAIGSFSWEIEQTAKVSGNEELGEIITNLSEEGIRKLLTLSSGPHMIVQRNYTDKTYTLPDDLNILSELEEKGLLEFNEPLTQFNSYFDSLKPEKRIVYKCNNGNTSTVKSASCNEKFIQKSVIINNLSQDDIKRIEEFNIELSLLGKKAFDIIVQVIGQQINRE